MLLSVAELGGSGSISEISDAVIKRQRYSDALQAVLHQDGPQTKIDYRLAWARSHLKMAWFLINSSRGIWSLTEAGDDLVRVGEPDGPPQLHGRPSFEHCGDHPPVEPQAPRDQEPVVLGPVGIQTDREEDWKSQLLESLMAMDPEASNVLLNGCCAKPTSSASTSRADPATAAASTAWEIYRLSLLGFPVFFRCKRGSVGSGAVRDFRGAMAGRGDKGLLITTGTFTADAKAKSTRDGTPPVDLIHRLLRLGDLVAAGRDTGPK